MDIKALTEKGFNTGKALELLGGSEEIYQKILDTYYQNIEVKIGEIENARKNGDIKRYTVEVHAVKSSSRQIGADELGELAYYLELKGKEGNTREIEAKTDDFIKEYRKIGEIIKPFVNIGEENAAVGQTKKKTSASLIKAKLLKIKQAAKKFNIDDINKTISEISEYELNDEQHIALNEMGAFAKAFDYESVMQTVDKLMKLL